MSDHTAGHHGVHHAHHAHRVPRAEYMAYFALIFLAAIPFAAVAWAWEVAHHRRLPVHGPFARAWREAGAITPAIFRP
jgi:hypothetical protein